MESTVFDRETMLDLLVNVIPLAILLFFIGLFVVANPFGGNPVYTYLQFAIVVLTFVLLVILTFFSARAVASDEHRIEGTVWEKLPPGAVPTGGEDAGERLPDEESAEPEGELPEDDDEGDEDEEEAGAEDEADGDVDADDADEAEATDGEGEDDADAAADEDDA
jgi:hypothetical protein